MCLYCWLRLQHKAAKLLRKSRAWGSASSGSRVHPDCGDGSVSPTSKVDAEVPLPGRPGDWPEVPFSCMILTENKPLGFWTASFQPVWLSEPAHNMITLGLVQGDRRGKERYKLGTERNIFSIIFSGWCNKLSDFFVPVYTSFVLF